MKKSKKIFNPDKLLYFALSLFLLIGIIFFKKISIASYKNTIKNNLLPKAIKKILRNENAKFSLSDLKESNGVYEFELTLQDQNNQKFVSYITKDGKILFTSGIKLDPLLTPSSATQTQQKKISCQDLEKSDSPKLTAFVVSNCPFGLQMQRVFKKAINELPALSSYLNIKYIGSVVSGKITSMHGEKEAQENLRQICIREEQKNLYWNYVSCYMKEGKTDDCLNTTGVDIIQLNSCMSNENRGLKYAQADFNLANKFKVGGSPTLLVNEKRIVSEFDFGGRVPNSIKEIICCAAKKKPEFCQQKISQDEVAVSFSKTDERQTGSNAAGGCGGN